jgi:hypothetical protein
LHLWLYMVLLCVNNCLRLFRVNLLLVRNIKHLLRRGIHYIHRRLNLLGNILAIAIRYWLLLIRGIVISCNYLLLLRRSNNIRSICIILHIRLLICDDWLLRWQHKLLGILLHPCYDLWGIRNLGRNALRLLKVLLGSQILLLLSQYRVGWLNHLILIDACSS